jgi:preprotein translocase subunit SecB
LETQLTQATVDFAAVGRVSKFSELKDIWLAHVSAESDHKAIGPLEADFTHSCSVASQAESSLEVRCAYHFVGRTSETQVVNIEIIYSVLYSLKAPEPLADADILQFANANGTLHSWPFVREFLSSLTTRMGFPPFKLGVMHFVPLKPAPKAAHDESTPPDQKDPA